MMDGQIPETENYAIENKIKEDICMIAKGFTEPTERVKRLKRAIVDAIPYVESERAVLVTESYKETEGLSPIMRRAKAAEKIFNNLPITIHDDELVVGAITKNLRSTEICPEFSYDWVEKEFETMGTRVADPFQIPKDTAAELHEAFKYWEGKTTSALADSYMSQETKDCIANGVFTVGNYFYGGVGHVCVDYGKVLDIGFTGIIKQVIETMEKLDTSDPEYIKKKNFYEAIVITYTAAINFAHRYAAKAREMAASCPDPVRKAELLQIAANCDRVPERGATNFYEACQAFWFVQILLQIEANGHSISPGRFDQYMYPYYQKDMAEGKITRDEAQELVDCIWVKLNDLNKARDAASAEGFAGYSLFQNLIVGGQNENGEDVTNDLSFLCIWASAHVFLPQPSLSVRVWNCTPHELLVEAAKLTRTGIGLPAYYNDEVIIPSLMNRGLTLEDARTYNIIGCVEPQKAGKTEGWHDAAFFNMCRPLELVFSNGKDKGEQVGLATGPVEQMGTFEEFYDAYKKQMEYCISLLVNADNAIDTAHADRCPLPFLSSMVDDCMKRGKTVQEGGAVYNFTGPQGFGIANVADSLYAVRKLVFEEKKVTLSEYKKALALNFGKGFDSITVQEMTEEIIKELAKAGQQPSQAQIAGIVKGIMNTEIPDKDRELCEKLLAMIDEIPKYGNDIEEVDSFAREVAYTYTKPLQNYRNPRGGIFQAGLYPVSANVPLGAQTGATPDGRLAHTPVADGVSPTAGRDIHGPTATANSVSKLDHGIASNGTLLNQKFHPSALSGDEGLNNFVALIRSYFDQKGSHMQFNVVDRNTLLDAQKYPEKYQHLVVRVAGYSALFTTLSRSLQDDIIRRTEQGF